MINRPQLLATAKGIVRDLMALAGVAAIAYGCWLAWVPLGYIVGGLIVSGGAIALAYLESRSTGDGEG